MTYEFSKKVINNIFSSLPNEICSLIYYFAKSKKYKKPLNKLYNIKYKFNKNDKHYIKGSYNI